MKLYICWGTFPTPRPGGHPCRVALHALRAAGHEPELIRSYGLAALPAAFNATSGRREVRRLSGQAQVPLLVTDDGEVIRESARIAEWAAANPARPPAAADQPG